MTKVFKYVRSTFNVAVVAVVPTGFETTHLYNPKIEYNLKKNELE